VFVVARRQRTLRWRVCLVADDFGKVDQDRTVLCSKQLETRAQYLMLKARIARTAKRSSQRKIAVQRTRWAESLGVRSI
jgi:hypothetical protein